VLAAIMKQSARVLLYSALSAWSVSVEVGGIALALATLDSDDAQQQRLQAELRRQREIRDVRLHAARVMRAVVSEIGDAHPSYVWKGRGWVAARHCAALCGPCPAPAAYRDHRLSRTWESLQTMATRQDVSKMQYDVDAALQRA